MLTSPISLRSRSTVPQGTAAPPEPSFHLCPSCSRSTLPRACPSSLVPLSLILGSLLRLPLLFPGWMVPSPCLDSGNACEVLSGQACSQIHQEPPAPPWYTPALLHHHFQHTPSAPWPLRAQQPAEGFLRVFVPTAGEKEQRTKASVCSSPPASSGASFWGSSWVSLPWWESLRAPWRGGRFEQKPESHCPSPAPQDCSPQRLWKEACQEWVSCLSTVSPRLPLLTVSGSPWRAARWQLDEDIRRGGSPGAGPVLQALVSPHHVWCQRAHIGPHSS